MDMQEELKMKEMKRIFGVLVIVMAMMAMFAYGCSSSDDNDNNNNNNNNNNNTDGDIVDTVDNNEQSETTADGDEAIENVEEETTDGDTSEEGTTEEEIDTAEEEPQEPPCGGSCAEGTICHEELNGGTCLPNCNDGDGTTIGDEFCYAQDVGPGFSPYDYYCRPDGQCVLNEFGRTCYEYSQTQAEDSEIDCEAVCQKVAECEPDAENCIERCNMGSHEFSSQFAQAFGDCVSNTQGCGPEEANNEIDKYCFAQAVQGLNPPTYVSTGCSNLRTWLSQSCNMSDDDINAKVKNCEMWGMTMKQSLFQNIINCTTGYCEDFDKCLAQSNCMYSRQF